MPRIDSKREIVSLKAEFDARVDAGVELPSRVRTAPASRLDRHEGLDFGEETGAPSWVTSAPTGSNLMSCLADVRGWLEAHPDEYTKDVADMIEIVDEFAQLEGLLRIRRLIIEP